MMTQQEQEDLTNEFIDLVWPLLDEDTNNKDSIYAAFHNAIDSWEQQ